MKLSVITILDDNISDHKKIFKDLNAQDDKNFELIIIFEISSNNVFLYVDQLVKELKIKNFKIIFNAKRKEYSALVKSAAQIAQGEFVYFLNIYSSFKENFTKELKNIASHNPADINEFKFQTKNLFKWEPKLRIKDKDVMQVDQNASIVAYTFPFIFNKLFRTEIINQSFEQNPKIEISFRNFLSYFFLFNAKTFKSINKVLISEQINIEKYKFLSIPFIEKEWKKIETYFKNNNILFYDAIEYAKLFYTLVLIPGILGQGKKSKIFLFRGNNKMQDFSNEKYFDKMQDFFEKEYGKTIRINEFVISQKPESIYLQKLTPLNNWNKILKSLE